MFILLPQAHKYQVTLHLLPRLHLDSSQYYIRSHDFINSVFTSTPVSELSRYSCQNYFVFSEHGGEAFRQTFRELRSRVRKLLVHDEVSGISVIHVGHMQRARLRGRIAQK